MPAHSTDEATNKLRAACPHCGRTFRYTASQQGKRGTCPVCGKPLHLVVAAVGEGAARRRKPLNWWNVAVFAAGFGSLTCWFFGMFPGPAWLMLVGSALAVTVFLAPSLKRVTTPSTWVTGARGFAITMLFFMTMAAAEYMHLAHEYPNLWGQLRELGKTEAPAQVSEHTSPTYEEVQQMSDAELFKTVPKRFDIYGPNLRSYLGGRGTMVVGEVANWSLIDWPLARLDVILYDEDGAMLDTDYAQFVEFATGQKRPFKITFSDIPSKSVGTYRLTGSSQWQFHSYPWTLWRDQERMMERHLTPVTIPSD